MPGIGPHVLMVLAISRGRIRGTTSERRDPAEGTLHPLIVRTSVLEFRRDSGKREDHVRAGRSRHLAQAARIIGVKTIAREHTCSNSPVRAWDDGMASAFLSDSVRAD